MTRQNKTILAAIVAIGAAGAGWAVAQRGSGAPENGNGEEGVAYVGRDTCAGCHQEQDRAWAGSHHDLAMREPTAESVRGDFDGATFTHRGVTTTFSRSAAGFEVETEGPDGELHTYDVVYTFGVEPLQQYLIELEGGRLQALSVAWDSRPAEAGGQRWFHTYPDEEIPPGDALHWTGPSQNWNYMCAECHSTDLRKNYDPVTDTYATEWFEVNVSCEACHGPGSGHVAWAESGDTSRNASSSDGEGRYGLIVELGDPGDGSWAMDASTGIAQRTQPPAPNRQIDTCARCHSRRSTLDGESPVGGGLLDTHLPQTLAEGLYHADGQIQDEVYVWGSFVQSAMYGAGVRCSDCHDAHSLALRAEGNGVCASCHLPTRFDTPEHHFHEAGTEAAQCVSCHMPATTYMVVDPRRDHSMRVPRPDLAEALEAPDACTGCHTDRSSDWAAQAMGRWYGDERRTEPHYGEALQAGRTGAAGAEYLLAGLLGNDSVPAIVRATALELLAQRPGPVFGAVLPTGLNDPDPQVRAIALRSLDVVPIQNRLQLASPLLTDPNLAVRTQAARVLAPVPRNTVPPGLDRILERATAEYVATLEATADHPSSPLALARLHAEQGRFAEAEQALRDALRTGPWFVPVWINLADLLRSEDRDPEGEVLLREALERLPDQPSLHYALGLLYTRNNRPEEALSALKVAADLGVEDPTYAYAYGLSLNSAGSTDRAIAVLEGAIRVHSNDRAILYALATIHRDVGQSAQGLSYARRLAELEPNDPEVQGLIQQLEGAP